jgi:hypothetical protein
MFVVPKKYEVFARKSTAFKGLLKGSSHRIKVRADKPRARSVTPECGDALVG